MKTAQNKTQKLTLFRQIKTAVHECILTRLQFLFIWVDNTIDNIMVTNHKNNLQLHNNCFKMFLKRMNSEEKLNVASKYKTNKTKSGGKLTALLCKCFVHISRTLHQNWCCKKRFYNLIKTDKGV